MNEKVCIVTGSSAGIGKETARGLAARGATVVMACRDLEKAAAVQADVAATTGRSDVAVMRLDLAETAQIRAFARAFAERFGRLDVLVDNAGVWPRRRATTKDGFESTFGVNHLGTALLTLELLDVLKRSAPSRVVVVASHAHYGGRMRWDDPQFERSRYDSGAAYYQSKLANVLFANALARRLRGSGVTANSLHPGVIVTELSRDLPRALVALAKPFLMTPAQGAECPLHVACAEELADVSGAYFEKSRPVPASAEARDESAQERLWTLTEQLIPRE